jgi:hypothetical protein
MSLQLSDNVNETGMLRRPYSSTPAASGFINLPEN